MQELMVASDIIVTDYSSCIFDFMLTKKLGIIYASDIDKKAVATNSCHIVGSMQPIK